MAMDIKARLNTLGDNLRAVAGLSRVYSQGETEVGKRLPAAPSDFPCVMLYLGPTTNYDQAGGGADTHEYQVFCDVVAGPMGAWDEHAASVLDHVSAILNAMTAHLTLAGAALYAPFRRQHGLQLINIAGRDYVGIRLEFTIAEEEQRNFAG